MISVIVYGRNDAHGYNPQRRVALSLNCLAEVLDDGDDEIVFVDYNTPEGLPTLTEAIVDTLSERCLSCLRVFRVRESAHTQRFGGRTHLPVVEPLARNIAARRTNPRNRWLLSTTTDMVLVPVRGPSLSEISAQLDDGFYGIPRYELPEWLWEQLPRSDARCALAEIERLGPALKLNETTTSHPEMQFDAPGDFQLILREDFFAIDGFDEAMIHGWHVDTNLSKRIFIHRGSIESLEDVVSGYHCNHNRTQTVYHGTALGNDLGRFFHDIAQAHLPEQRETWGMRDDNVEVVSLGTPVNAEFTSAVLAANESEVSTPVIRVDATETRFALEYDSQHILPYIADAIRTAPRDARFGYVGANRELERRLDALIATWTGSTLLVPRFENPSPIVDLNEAADILVVDLGVDASNFDTSVADGSGPEFTRSRQALVETFDGLRQLIALERERLAQGKSQRRFVLVNSTALYWNAFVIANLKCGSTTPHARVRNAVVRSEPERSDDALRAEVHAARLVRWIARDDSSTGRLHVADDRAVSIDELADYSGFGRGWAFPDWDGIWTRGAHSELAVALGEQVQERVVLSLGFDAIGVQPPNALIVTLRVNGVAMETRTFVETESASKSDAASSTRPRRMLRNVLATAARQARSVGVPGVDTTIAALRSSRRLEHGYRFNWSILLPKELRSHGELHLVLALSEPVLWADDRLFGLHLRSLKISRA